MGVSVSISTCRRRSATSEAPISRKDTWPLSAAGAAGAGAGQPSASSSERMSRARSMTRLGTPRQARNLDAVALVGGAGDDLAQENHIVLPLLGGHIVVLHPGDLSSRQVSSW